MQLHMDVAKELADTAARNQKLELSGVGYQLMPWVCASSDSHRCCVQNWMFPKCGKN